MAIATVGIIGAGTMGNGIAQAFAQAGFQVRLVDVAPLMLERARRAIDRSLAKFVEKGTLTAPDRDAALARLTTHDTLTAIADADYVVEAIVEDATAKQALFAHLDTLVRPDVILASNTSSIPISTLAAATNRPDRVLGMHFMNPVPLMVLVEVIRGARTSDASMRVAMDLCTALGKTAVESADRPGFIANRVLMPMINEAIYAVAEGVGTPQAVDDVMRLGMHHPMGPLTLADFIGLDVCLSILRVLRDGFGDAKYTPCPLLERMVAAGTLGRKSGEGFYKYLMADHIGIVGVSAEGAALCYKTICIEGAQYLGQYDHPEVTMHTHSLGEYMKHITRGDWTGVADLMLSSAHTLEKAGADFLICPDNTVHQAFGDVESRSPLPWIHIADPVADEAIARKFRRLALTGTRWLVESDVYPSRLGTRGVEFIRPAPAERENINRIIFDELQYGVFNDAAVACFQGAIARMKTAGCDAVVLGCTEIPLLMNDGNSPLPTLDSTRLLARAALRRAVQA